MIANILNKPKGQAFTASAGSSKPVEGMKPPPAKPPTWDQQQQATPPPSKPPNWEELQQQMQQNKQQVQEATRAKKQAMQVKMEQADPDGTPAVGTAAASSRSSAERVTSFDSGARGIAVSNQPRHDIAIQPLRSIHLRFSCCSHLRIVVIHSFVRSLVCAQNEHKSAHLHMRSPIPDVHTQVLQGSPGKVITEGIESAEPKVSWMQCNAMCRLQVNKLVS